MNKKLYQRVGFIVIILVVIAVNYFEPSKNKILKEAYEVVKYEKFNGIVQDKYFDKENHNHPTLTIKNSYGVQDVLFLYDKSDFFEFVKKGDSISKEYGKYEIKIFRQEMDTCFMIQY